MSNYSNKSANTTCQRCPKGQQKVIYLTFDDGPEPGTEEIYDALKSISIPATFFFVGENVIATENGTFQRRFPKWNLKPGLFKKIFNDPLFQIGNHSQTQSHQFYRSYYDKGLRINPKTLRPSATSKHGSRRSVLVDFEFSSMAFSYALNGVAQQYPKEMFKVKDYGYRGKKVVDALKASKVKPYFRFLAGRMPGTNRWRLPKKKPSRWDFRGPDRDDEADNLFDNGYRIFGWDLEWHFSRSDKGSDMSDDVRKEHEAGKDGWWDYYSSNISKDRPMETADQMVKETSDKLDALSDFYSHMGSSKDPQVVILMHDRQFRPGGKKDPKKYTNLLLDFVKKCKAKGLRFDVLENYQP